MALPSARVVRVLALSALAPAVALAALVLWAKPFRSAVAHGPLITAHAGVDCQKCHLTAPGSIRQQLQAQVKYALGYRKKAVDFGYSKVRSSQCLSCHSSPNDRHPIYRFREPRFATAVKEVNATSCLGCHSEHRSSFLSTSTTFCSTCHEDLIVKSDPIEITHKSLIEDAQWDSCISCHGYHGNHIFSAPKRMADRIPSQEIQEYLHGERLVFGATKKFEVTSP